MNAESEALALISPLGLVLRTKAYVDNNWWPILILICTALIITVLAYRLNYKRDIDQGLIPARRGRAEGSSLMRTPFGLSFKLLRTSIIVWIAGMFMLAAAYGTVMGELDEFIASNEMYHQLILGPAGIEYIDGLSPEQTVEVMRAAVDAAGFTTPELFSSMTNNMMGMLAMVPLLMFILKAKSEETDSRTEKIIAAPIRRKKYLAGFAIIAFISAVLIQLALALGMYSVAASVLPDPSELTLSYLLEANLVYVPALWVIIGIAILLIGLKPKLTGAIWGYFAYSFLIVFIGRIDILPAFMSYITPMGHVPQLPMEQTNYPVLGILTIVAIATTIAGFHFYTKRDINAITH
jgi:ABC-2 type transport system permease protein